MEEGRNNNTTNSKKRRASGGNKSDRDVPVTEGEADIYVAGWTTPLQVSRLQFKQTRSMLGGVNHVQWQLVGCGLDTDITLDLVHDTFWGSRTIMMNDTCIVKERKFVDGGSTYDMPTPATKDLNVKLHIIDSITFEYQLEINGVVAEQYMHLRVNLPADSTHTAAATRRASEQHVRGKDLKISLLSSHSYKGYAPLGDDLLASPSSSNAVGYTYA